MATHPKSKLTDAVVRSVKPPTKDRGNYPDSVVPGFMLRVTSSGAKSFALNCRWPGSGEAEENRG